MLTFYYNAAPNPMKVALFLEEAGLDYEARPLDTRKGEQFQPDYLAINPNAKAPAIVDEGQAIFDSNAILLYLAEKTGKFLPEDGPAARGEMLSWLMFVASGVGPLDYRYRERMPTIVTTNVPQGQTPARLRDRLRDKGMTMAFGLDLPSYRTGEVLT